MSKQRIAFMGTPDFAATSLQALINAKDQLSIDIVAVYSQPPRPSGRGKKLQASAVHQLAEKNNIPVFTPTSLKSTEAQKQFTDLKLDLAVVAAYGLILPEEILSAPRLGCINIHASLLPRWRGAAPIQRAILAGDVETGITLMQMDEGLDTGAMISVAKTRILPTTTTAELHDTLSTLGASLLLETLPQLADITPQPQPVNGVTYADKLHKEEGRLDWSLPAAQLDRQIRALNPWPGTWFSFDGMNIKVHTAKVTEQPHTKTPGTVLDNQLSIACKDGIFSPTILQKPGGKRLPTEEFLKGLVIPTGTLLTD